MKPREHTHPTPSQTMNANPIDKNHEELTNQVVERHRNAPSFLMKRKQGKVVNGNIIEEMQLGFGYRKEALRMALNTRLQAMEEYCTHMLVTGKAQYRKERNNFFAEQQVELQQQMNQLADRFNQEIDQHLEKIDSYRNEHLKQREQERLLKAIDDFMDTIDALMDDFKSIFKTHVNRQEV